MTTFSTMAMVQPRGVLWLVRERIKQHRDGYGGRLPVTLILHTGTLRSLFNEYLQELGEPPDSLPPVEGVIFGAFEGVRLYHCRCGQPLARDALVTCDDTAEDL